jgi:hypothetical protein
MKSRSAVALAGAAALLALAAAPAAARPSPTPVVDVQPFAAIAPDGRSAAVQVIASCPERWTVVEAVLSVSQPQSFGQASFPLECVGFLQVFNVTVPVSAGVFDLGSVQVGASVIVKRGKTASSQDAETIQPSPIVAVDISGTARLVEGGATIDVTVASQERRPASSRASSSAAAAWWTSARTRRCATGRLTRTPFSCRRRSVPARRKC